LSDAVSANRNPTVAAVAIPMPTALIASSSVDAQTATAGDSRGTAAVKAHGSAANGDGVVVAVLETGIDRTHEAFAGVELVEKDFSGSGDGDGRGDGTHCAGTIFGRDVGGQHIGSRAASGGR
jgi:subtilisin family serine protease